MITDEMPLSRNKVVVPALRPEILHRARLLTLFDDLLDKKLIIVTAPAGYGKTTLLVDFARQSRLPVCWLSLDSLDKDPQRFCAYLIAALERRFPKFGKQSKSVLRSLTSFEQDTERLLSVLANEIDRLIDEHFVLIVDDYQFVDAVPYIRDLFSRFIYMAGENCHFILSSRRLPALPDIAIMVARQQIGGFALEQLTFRPDEIRSLFELDYGITLADADLEELMRQTEGWVTGLHLSASGRPNGVPDLTRAARAAGVDLAGYFDQQVLALLSPELRKFLLQTSLLEEFDAALCNAVLGEADWKKLFKTAQQNNLFVLPVGPDGKWLRYHHLFQEFLQERIREEEPETAQAILSRLAEVYKERHEWEKAYAIYHQAGNPNLLADLVELAGIPMLLSERLITLQAWLEDLPAKLFRERPSLLSLKGVLLCALMINVHEALALFDRAIAEFQRVDDIPGLALALIRRAAAYRLVGDYANSLQDTDEVLRLSKNKPDLQTVYTEAERFKGINLNHLGRLAEAAGFQEDALRHYEALGDEQRAAWVRMELGMTYRSSGNYESARNAYERSLTEWKREDNLANQANVLNSLGVLHHSLGDYEPAVRAFEAGLEIARYAGSTWREALLLASLGDVYTDMDEYEAAIQAYNHAAQMAQQLNYQFLINYLFLAQSHLARVQGKLKEAYVNLDKAAKLIKNSKSNHEWGLYYLECGCLKLMEEDPGNAIAAMEQALDYFQRGGLAAETASSRVWLAAAHFRSGEIAAGRSHLQIALGAGNSDPLFSALLQAIRQARPWLAGLKEDNEIGPSLAAWLERVVQAEARLPGLRKRLRHLLTSVPIQAPRLAIQAFGKARVRVNGKWVTPAQWKGASVRELFFYILSASRPLSKEEIGETLWPELDNDQLKLRFKNNLYRLRHALGQEVLLFENDLYHFNHYMDYDYDVEIFSAHLAKAKAARRLEDRISYLHIAASSRIGPYLQDIDATWVLAERERLDRACMDALRQLADSHRQMGNLQAAWQACHEALKIDACREDIHRLAMRLCAERGERLEVIWQYQACRKALREQLDVDPSEETEALYRRLTA